MKRDQEGYLVFDNVTEWREETRYYDTTVATAKSQVDIQRMLMDRYKADQVIISERQGGQIVVAFEWKGKRYVIPVRRAKIRGETKRDIDRLMRQAFRVLHWYLKGILEMRFLVLEEEMLMPFQMLQAGDQQIRVADAILGGLLRPALPPGDEGGLIEGEFTEKEGE